MPQIGQDITRGNVVRWLKKEGDSVRRGEIIVTVESEKASFDVEAVKREVAAFKPAAGSGGCCGQ